MTLPDFLKDKLRLVQQMPAVDTLELVLMAYDKYQAKPSTENAAAYNWWVDVYNFKRGAIIVKNVEYRKQQPLQVVFEKHFAEHLRA